MRKPFETLWTGNFRDGADIQLNRLDIDDDCWEFHLFDSSEGRLSFDLEGLTKLYEAIGKELSERGNLRAIQWNGGNTREVIEFISDHTKQGVFVHNTVRGCRCIKGHPQHHMTIHQPNQTYITMRIGDWVCIENGQLRIQENDPLRK